MGIWQSWKRFQQRHVLKVLLFAAALIATYKVNDGHILHNLIVSSDRIVAASVYLTLGGWIGLAVNFLLIKLGSGKVLDPDFVKLSRPTRKTVLRPMVVGTLSAVTTFATLWASALYDPTLVAVLSNATVLYVMLYEVYKGRIQLRAYFLPALLIFAGGAIASVDITTGITFSFGGMLLLLGFKNIVNAATKILEQTGVLKSDATDFGFWRFFWLTISGTLLSILFSFGRGTFNEYLNLLGNSIGPALPFILLTMLIVYFANGFETVSLKYTNITTVSILIASSIIFGIPVTFVVNFLWPNTFTDTPTSALVWGTRFVAALCVFIGVALLQQLKSKLRPSVQPASD